MAAVYQTDLPDIPLIGRGKVRDLYDLGGHMLMVATDRLSAFDVVMSQPVPDKGRVLTQISIFWFDLFKDIVENHLVTADIDRFPEVCKQYRDQLEGRSMVVRKARPLPVECIVRGYISGSGWKDYQQTGKVCGIDLPTGLVESDILGRPMFTPSTKAELGDHDENISMEQARELAATGIIDRAADISLRLYERARDYAAERGIIIADTKFEFGLISGRLVLIDEVLTPDSSRFWPADEYKPGGPQPSFDKQYVRDYLETLDWDKKPPPPDLPEEVVVNTRKRYIEAIEKLSGKGLD